ncbi:Putative Chase2 sensor protein [Planktothrix tepida]|uniref:Chase2 sensor protein n=2 Tax=Planktothrix TaxID=54304 RepID=A0A9W4D8V4_9CYAN|nr:MULTISPECIES: CHASE2 domain-containing protein [Planktothrix]CAD5947191.1 Putative Chase2 sensor protein [Planktothrix tepida]CAD5963720.1 Putative Chase2 sensor protein [Planktothrix pseudagardhii]CUR32420.1 putative Chase2 sensor protein [Planktothrix tepida PCC 9214]
MTDKIVLLNLGLGDLIAGFPGVTVMVLDSGNPYPMKFNGSLPSSSELMAIARRWQLMYQSLYQSLAFRPRIELETEDITQVSQVEFGDICQQYKSYFNNWLNSPEFRKIDQKLRSILHPSDSIQLILETDNIPVRRLPWHQWQFLQDYPQTEFALSTPEYHQQFSSNSIKTHLRILAILGDSRGIDVNTDRQLLTTLPDVETVFLVEPSREQLDEQLWNQQGWDILFFAGHSCSLDPEETGEFVINPQERVAVRDLIPGFKKAIERGLTLAIFNSCDGLGIATELTQLNIPQMIVMREPVADAVAHHFLKFFLQKLISGDSFYLSVREARERLYILENQFPCASWLPVICQNPAVLPLKFKPQIPQKKALFKNKLKSLSSFPIAVNLSIIILIIGFRFLGGFEFWELHAYDQLMRSRPPEQPDKRLLLVTITENDIQNLNGESPLTDQKLSQVLKSLQRHQPRVIGLNVYRDRPKPPGSKDFTQFLMDNPKQVMVICQGKSNNSDGTQPPSKASPNQIGFSDIQIDSDGVLRRQIMFMPPPENCKTDYGFSTRVAFNYLEGEGIKPERIDNTNIVILNNTFFKPLIRVGFYVENNIKMFQILLNYRNSVKLAKSVSLTEVLNQEVDPNLIKDKIVLIGTIASSYVVQSRPTPYSKKPVPGLFLQAEMVSQIISAVLDGRALMTVWPISIELLWISLWSLLGGGLAWIVRDQVGLLVIGGSATGVLYGVCWLFLVQGVWVPLVTPGLGLVLSALLIRLK